MKRSNICGLTKAALTETGVTRPRLSLDEVKADAKHTGLAQVIGHRLTGHILIVLPGGAVFGTRECWFQYEAESVAATLPCGYVVRMDEEVG